MNDAIDTMPPSTVSHLTPPLWARANRRLVRKALAEFGHERLIEPRAEDASGEWARYRVDADGSTYRFRARRLALDHWHIDADSIERQAADGRTAPLDAVALVTELREALGLGDDKLPVYLEEVISTLYGSAYKEATATVGAAGLAEADFQTLEAGMTEGHPTFVANNGRLGFDAADYRAYAPEAATPVNLIWVAAHASRATFAAVDGLDYRDHLTRELGAAALAGLDAGLRGRGLDPEDYVYLPVHPWQWTNKISGVFAPDIAEGYLVCLGTGADRYQAQQSIRTLFNLSVPRRCYVKTALSVLNMGFMRGLSPYYMRTTPAINDWLHGLIEADDYLRARGFRILREVATVGYRNERFELAVSGDSPYKKMLAALWRESPVADLAPGQRLMTMAALLHVDHDGEALLPALIRASGLTAEAWLRRYLDCYLAPLVHCFYAHDLVFMPHGENLILVLEDHVPVRAIMKDVAEEIGVLNDGAALPPAARRVAVDVPEELRTLSIFTDVFDGVFRYLSAILDVQGDLAEDRFWALVGECIADYQRAHPGLRPKFRRDDLFVPEFRRSCLNRLQLANNEQLIDLADPTRTLQFVGTLANPVAGSAAAALRGTG